MLWASQLWSRSQSLGGPQHQLPKLRGAHLLDCSQHPSEGVTQVWGGVGPRADGSGCGSSLQWLQFFSTPPRMEAACPHPANRASCLQCVPTTAGYDTCPLICQTHRKADLRADGARHVESTSFLFDN